VQLLSNAKRIEFPGTPNGNLLKPAIYRYNTLGLMTMEKIFTILIADDDPQMRGFIKDVLAATASVRILQARSVREALFITNSSSFDFAFIDQHFPDGTAADYCKALDNISKNRNVAAPKVLITGEKPLSWDEDFWKRYGIQEYIIKPCKTDDILNAVKPHLEGVI